MFKIQAAEEAIWHFIGLFHIVEERGRLRTEYDRISVKQSDDESGPIEPMDIATGYPFVPASFIPNIKYVPPATPMDALAEAPGYPQTEIAADLPASATQVPSTSVPLPAAATAPAPLHYQPPEFYVPPVINWVLPPPGSIAVVIVQQNILVDDDRINPDSYSGHLVSSEKILAKLDGLVDQSGLLGIALNIARPADEGAFIEMVDAFATAAAPEAIDDAAMVSTRHGEDAQGQYLNGEAVDERPDVGALLPKYRQPEPAEDEDEALTEEELNAGKTADAMTVAGGEVEAGQQDVILGNNTLVNQTAITSGWIAAPVMAVGGDVYSYTIISQTNTWSDADELAGDIAAADAADPTLALNYSTYAHYSNPMPDREGDGEQPQYWVTATVQGSLISVNWVEQYNIVTDNEIISATLQADQTMMIMGENGALNEVSLTELGTQYDLIIIDGHIINLNSIQQSNVMLDDDMIMVSGGDGAMISSGDNLMVNDSSIVQVGDASINAADDDYVQVLETAANGEVILPESVLNDPAFQDLDVVRVLHIQGDLVSVNMISQQNVLGDADQVELFLGEMADQGAEVEIVSGSNVMINSATIAEIGVDSEIYVGGEVYSDALLHQAELISTDDPLMAGAAELASEAVLFLAEGMLNEDAGEAEFTPIGSDAAVSADAMETVLS